MKNIRLQWLTVLLLLAAIGLIGYRLLFMAPETAPQPRAAAPQEEQATTLGGHIIYVEGAVEWRRGAGDWLRAATGLNLQEGDAVETLAGGRAIVGLDDGSVLRLDENSMLTLSSLDPEHLVVSNDNGSLYSRVVRSERVFEVVAGDIVYESLGTAYLTHNYDDLKGVEVYHSKVKVKEGADKQTVVDEGKMYFALHPDKPAQVEDINKEDVDEDKFVQWNKEKDWSKFKDELGYLNDSEEPQLESLTLEHQGGAEVAWLASEPAQHGYKLVWSKTSGPTYPTRDTDTYIYYDDPAQTTGEIYAFDGAGSYYVRVCEYLRGPCGTYSNELQVDLESKDTDYGSAKAVPEGEDYEVPDKKNQSGGISSINLQSDAAGNVLWDWEGYADQGWKVVWSKNAGPTYPTRNGDKYQYFDDPGRRAASVWAFNGDGTYQVRVCEYLGGRCGVYSNEITVELQGEDKESSDDNKVSGGVSGLTLTAGGDGNVSWVVDGYSAKGFKVVWSKNSGPTYPTRSGDKYKYFDDPSRRATSLQAFSGSGTYHVRVCEYLGGKCDIYSNEITIDL